MEKQSNVISESYYYSPQDKELYMIIQSKKESDGSETAVLKSINGDCKLVYDYSITGSSMTWLHSVTYPEQDEALKVLLTEKKNSEYAHLDKSPAFKRSTPKY